MFPSIIFVLIQHHKRYFLESHLIICIFEEESTSSNIYRVEKVLSALLIGYFFLSIIYLLISKVSFNNLIEVALELSILETLRGATCLAGAMIIVPIHTSFIM